MSSYEYRCARDGVFEQRHAMGTAPPTGTCPQCGGSSSRVFSPPLLGTRARGALSLIDATERTASEPDVVSAPPPRRTGGPARTAKSRPEPNPALARLPRP
ncbi:FmdB family zinc ribbon protein [Kineococcus sp. SYSU DK003]|uniref:FmdB family zinc ribbon protein n=1 Tax=Kineococcus sp. SYSU DK003 TaxID=3383124 RepID=UPI003D7D1B38